MEVHKGDIVLASGRVETMYTSVGHLDGVDGTSKRQLLYKPKLGLIGATSPIKCLFRFQFAKQREGVVIGQKMVATGYYYEGDYDPYEGDTPPYLIQDKRHKVWAVEPLDGDRYRDPWYCLEEDLAVRTALQNEEAIAKRMLKIFLDTPMESFMARKRDEDKTE